MTAIHPTERVYEVLKNVLNTQESLESVDLIESGLMDSLALVSVIMELETTFGISIPFEKLEVDNFRTLDGITQFIAKESKLS
jgi:acyl carrier protein